MRNYDIFTITNNYRCILYKEYEKLGSFVKKLTNTVWFLTSLSSCLCSELLNKITLNLNWVHMVLERFAQNNGYLAMRRFIFPATVRLLKRPICQNLINRNGFPYSQIKRKYAKLK